MKRITIIYIITLILATASLIAQDSNYKVFPFKSGIIEYKQEGNATGSHTKYIEDYGYKQADFTETETTIFGFTSKENNATILIGPELTVLDYKSNTASIGKNPVYETYANSKNANYEELGKMSLKKLGFKNTGNKEKISGKNCEIWEGTLGKIWTWKGLALKSVTSVLGITITEIATTIKIDTKVPASKFEIPKGMKTDKIDIPQDMGGLESMFGSDSNLSDEDKQIMENFSQGNIGAMMSQEEKEEIKKVAGMPYSDFKRLMKEEEPNISDKEVKEAYNAIQELSKKIN
ncbi:MAG: hypothetical protein KAH10_09130 [Flavobacteriales bacterium]|nr:hypothetical protein [Flavobacteriales bacterium]